MEESLTCFITGHWHKCSTRRYARFRAAEFFAKAAALGNVQAQYGIGRLYAIGNSVVKITQNQSIVFENCGTRTQARH